MSYVVPVKSKVEISQNLVAFSEYMNFNKIKFVKHWVHEEVNFCLFIISFNISLFRDVDTIQEFTDILILDSCGLLDESGRLADGFDGVSCKLEIMDEVFLQIVPKKILGVLERIIVYLRIARTEICQKFMLLFGQWRFKKKNVFEIY